MNSEKMFYRIKVAFIGRMQDGGRYISDELGRRRYIIPASIALGETFSCFERKFLSNLEDTIVLEIDDTDHVVGIPDAQPMFKQEKTAFING